MSRKWSTVYVVVFVSAAGLLAVVIGSLRVLHDTSPEALSQRRQQFQAAPQHATSAGQPAAPMQPAAAVASPFLAAQAGARVERDAAISLPALQLLGTILEADPARSSALIQELPEAVIRSCHPGEELQGWRLTEIGRAYIVLALSGRTHRVAMTGQAAQPAAGGDTLGTVASLLTTGTIPAKQWLAPEQTTAVKEAIQELSPTEHIVDRAKMFEALKQESPLRVLREAAVQPVLEGGKLAGAKLQSVPQDGVLTHSGFQTGDVVRRINGQPVTDLRVLFDLPNALAQQELITVSVERNGQPVTLTFTVQ